MDVRLSNTAGYTNSSSDYGRVKASPKSYEADVVRLEGVYNSNQLKRLENQGVSVSTGEEQTVRALERVLKALEGPETTLQVSVHKETKAIMVKVLNKDTGELIREIPPEKTLDIVANMMEIAGIIIDQKV
ncbi:flagellar protein flag protein [Paenibacillus sp. FSL R7-277]|uniref:flagellar protein FlaG n=1 Tax=unclassified Paenibacillus TaxID=185978 RepID=UPI0003E23911|nr:flagellar protein FlaG [Paenibacillus sp. FSL R7-277]ETT80094.1 flagellar protein flag protein [Paenibacillus sp. FSL R7-277]